MDLLKWFFKLLKRHCADKISAKFEVTKNFEIYDKGLVAFLKDVGGTEAGFTAVL